MHELAAPAARRHSVAVNGDAYDLRAGAGEGGNLRGGRSRICRIGVGHRLNDDRGPTAHSNVANVDRD